MSEDVFGRAKVNAYLAWRYFSTDGLKASKKGQPSRVYLQNLVHALLNNPFRDAEIQAENEMNSTRRMTRRDTAEHVYPAGHDCVQMYKHFQKQDLKTGGVKDMESGNQLVCVICRTRTTVACLQCRVPLCNPTKHSGESERCFNQHIDLCANENDDPQNNGEINRFKRPRMTVQLIPKIHPNPNYI